MHITALLAHITTHVNKKYPWQRCVLTDEDSDRRSTISALKNAHARFVLVPIDKASNNVGIICRKFYIQLLNKELGISLQGDETNVTGNETYSQFHGQVESLIQLHREATLRFCSEPLAQENETIPRLWLTLKCHKNPIKFRFISGARLCTTKQLSVTLANLLKMLRAHFIRYRISAFISPGVVANRAAFWRERLCLF